MDLELSDFSDYRLYLKAAFDSKTMPRGSKSRLAESLGCQSSFLSQVVTERAHLTLEHAIKVTEYLNLSKDESDYFMISVQKSKAGSVQLQDYFQVQLEAILQHRELVSEKIKVKDRLSKHDQAQYYSAWWYAAIHISSSLPTINKESDFCDLLDLEIAKVTETLSFLMKLGLVNQVKGKYQIGRNRVHLGQNSSLISTHHKNWRYKTAANLDNMKQSDLHFSGVIALSAKDANKIKKLALKLIKESEQILADSPEEVLRIFNIDFFET